MEIRISDFIRGMGDTSVELSPAPALSSEKIKEMTMKKIEKQASFRPSARRPLRARKLWHTLLIAAVITAMLSGTALAVHFFSGIRSVAEDLTREEPEVKQEGTQRMLDQIASEVHPQESSQNEVLTEGVVFRSGGLFLDEDGKIGRQNATAVIGDRTYELQPQQTILSRYQDGVVTTSFRTVNGDEITVTGEASGILHADQVRLLADGTFVPPRPFVTLSQDESDRSLHEEEDSRIYELPPTEWGELTWYVSSIYTLGAAYHNSNNDPWGREGMGWYQGTFQPEEDDWQESWKTYKQGLSGDWVFAPSGSPQRLTLSLAGTTASPEVQALTEWEDYCYSEEAAALSPQYWFQKLDFSADEEDEEQQAILENFLRLNQASYAYRDAHPEYEPYDVYTPEMAEKLESILSKYGLQKLSGRKLGQTMDELYEILGLEDFIDHPEDSCWMIGDSPNTVNGYAYADGTFKIEGCLYRPQEENGFGYSIYRAMKGSFNSVSAFLIPAHLEEWDYETKSGTVVHIAASDVDCRIFADLPTAFISVALDQRGLAAVPEYGLAELTHADIEAFCDAIHWDVLG